MLKNPLQTLNIGAIGFGYDSGTPLQLYLRKIPIVYPLNNFSIIKAAEVSVRFISFSPEPAADIRTIGADYLHSTLLIPFKTLRACKSHSSSFDQSNWLKKFDWNFNHRSKMG